MYTLHRTPRARVPSNLLGFWVLDPSVKHILHQKFSRIYRTVPSGVNSWRQLCPVKDAPPDDDDDDDDVFFLEMDLVPSPEPIPEDESITLSVVYFRSDTCMLW